MAPRDTNKTKSPTRTPRTVSKTSTKIKPTPLKKEKAPLKDNPTIGKTPLKEIHHPNIIRQRTNTVPKTPRNKETVPSVAATGSCSKPTWKRRPRPAHSGVPVPEKMRKLFEKRLQDSRKEAAATVTAS